MGHWVPTSALNEVTLRETSACSFETGDKSPHFITGQRCNALCPSVLRTRRKIIFGAEDGQGGDSGHGSHIAASDRLVVKRCFGVMSVHQYMVKASDGREYGPVDLTTLQEWVKQGRVSHETKVRNLGNGMLLQASNMPELDGFFAQTFHRQNTAIASGMIHARPGEVPEHWEDFRFIFAMSVLGLLMSLVLGWFAVIFCVFALVRAWNGAKAQRPMSGLAFAVALSSLLGVIAIPFLVGTWIQSVLNSFMDHKRP